MKFESIEEFIGDTPHMRFRCAELPATRIWVKLEGQNPTGSVKDRPAWGNIQGAIRSGEIRKGRTILDASSGSMACSLAYFGAVLGYGVTVVCSSKLTQDKRQFIEYFGAKLIQTGDYTIEGNTHCKDMISGKNSQGYVFLDQLHNWDNPTAHFNSTGPEIAQDFPDLAMVVGSLGSGGTMNGVARYMKSINSTARIAGVEAASGTKIPGTGAFADGDYVTPFIDQLFQEDLLDFKQAVSLENAQNRTRDLRDQGLFCGLQTGGVLDATIALVHAHDIAGDVVMISGDAGWKNMDKLIAL